MNNKEVKINDIVENCDELLDTLKNYNLSLSDVEIVLYNSKEQKINSLTNKANPLIVLWYDSIEEKSIAILIDTHRVKDSNIIATNNTILSL